MGRVCDDVHGENFFDDPVVVATVGMEMTHYSLSGEKGWGGTRREVSVRLLRIMT